MLAVVISCYIVGLLVWFCLLWFDSLWQLPFAAVVVAGFLFSLYFAFGNIRKKKAGTAHLASLFPFGIVVLSVLLLFLPLNNWKVRVDHKLFCSQRIRFIDEIRAQVPLLEGAVKLPHRWLSQDGEAYVFNSEPERLIVGFWVRRGVLSPSWCIVFTAQDAPPTAADMRCDMVEVFSKLSPHWYYIHFD